jgi:hypothetical protein
MDLNLAKQKLAAAQNKGQQREKIDYTKIFFKPKPGKYQVRILPNKYDKAWPIREVKFHYGFAKGPILALSNWSEADPIADFAKNLRKSSDKEDWQLAKKIEPKSRYFAAVVVRGEEHLGARLWEFGKLTNDQLLGIAADDDYGDFTDITDGRDFTIDAVEDTIAGRKGIKCNLRVKPKTTPISDDAALVEKLLNDQPDILGINRKYTYEQLKDVLSKWLNPEEETTTETPTAPKKEEDEEDDFLTEMNKPVAPAYSLENNTGKTSNADKFNDLFSDDVPF